MSSFKQPLRWIWLATLIVLLTGAPLSYAQNFSQDLFIAPSDLKLPTNVLVGAKVRIYATVHNAGTMDLAGVVKFYNERTQSFMGPDQPVSVLKGSTDDVFMDWDANELGEHRISVRVLPWNEAQDNPANNKVTAVLYVDRDADNDGIGDRVDPDDDNDGTPDAQDAFVANPNESEDTDRDGIGNNADPDDDNDGVPDAEDRFPTDKNEFRDSDGDNVGDHSDAFPMDPTEKQDTDQDGLGDNKDPNNANKGPSAVIDTAKTRVIARKEVTFNALKSRDLDGVISTYVWDFGDGEKANTVVADHAFKKPGTYKVTLTVTDDKNESRSTALEIRVMSRWQIPGVLLAIIFLLLILRKRMRHRPISKGSSHPVPAPKVAAPKAKIQKKVQKPLRKKRK